MGQGIQGKRGDSKLGDDGNIRGSMLTASYLTRAPVLTGHTALENFWGSMAAGRRPRKQHTTSDRVTEPGEMVIPDCRSNRRLYDSCCANMNNSTRHAYRYGKI